MAIATTSTFYIEQVRQVTVLCFTVRSLTEQNYDLLSEELLEFVTLVTTEKPIQVVAEMSSIQEIDGIGLAMLQAFNESIDDAGGTLILCRIQPSIQAAMSKAGLRYEFNLRDTRGEAMWAF